MGESRPPPFVICHLCGRKYGTKSIGIHVPQCEKKWHSENKKLPKNLRRSLPSQPDYGKIQSGDISADVIDQLNEMSFKAAQAQLIPCENCGRTFYPEKLPIHQRSCTSDKPARPPRGNPSATKSPLKDTMRNPAKAKQKRQSPSNSQVNTILCVICMKQIPQEKIQSHLVSCNEQKIKCLSKKNPKDDEDVTPAEKIPRPSTRIIRRGQKSENGATGTLTADDKDGTYDILKRSASYTVEKSVVIDTEFFPCDLCNRKFTRDRITQHKVICSKLKSKERKTFDSSKQRLQGIEFYNRNSRKKQSVVSTTPKSNWRLKHEEFIQAIKAAKQLKAHMAKGGKASDIPPPPPSLNPDYVHCKYCDRRFNPEVAERHIPKCATTKNRPAPPKKKALDVYNKQARSKGLKKSETFSVRQSSTEKIKAILNGNSFSEIKGSNLKKQKRVGNDCSGYVSPRIENRYDSFETIQDKKNNNYRSLSSMTNYNNNNNSDSENSCQGKRMSRKTSSQKNNVGYSYNSVKRKSPPRNKNFVF